MNSADERKVHIYIRAGDWEKWRSIKDKPGWLHTAINDGFVPFKGIAEVLDSAGFDNKHTIGQLRKYLENPLREDSK